MMDMKGQLVGYARESSADQNLDRQILALGDVDRLFQDKASGRNADRPQLTEMLAYVREGDVVRVKSPDRLGRSTLDVLTLVQDLAKRGVAVEFIDSPILSTATAQGEFMLTILAAVAQLEFTLIHERQAEGIAIAKAAGKYDRGPKLSAEQVDKARERVADGVPKAVVARDLGVARTTLYAALAGTGRYARVDARPSVSDPRMIA